MNKNIAKLGLFVAIIMSFVSCSSNKELYTHKVEMSKIKLLAKSKTHSTKYDIPKITTNAKVIIRDPLPPELLLKKKMIDAKKKKEAKSNKK